MDGPSWSLAEDLAARRWVSAAVKILFRLRGFVLSSPLRVLGPHEPDTANSEFFDREGCQLLRDVVAFILIVARPRGSPARRLASRSRVRLRLVTDGGLVRTTGLL